jgi:dGTPase
MPRFQKRGIARDILREDALVHLDLSSFAGGEAQVAALADDIAYNSHDLDDGLRAGLFPLSDLNEVPFLADILTEIYKKWHNLEDSRVIHELGRRLITRFVEGVIEESRRRLLPVVGLPIEAIRNAGEPVIVFGNELTIADRDIKRFLFAKMYRNADVMRVRGEADTVVRDLYNAFVSDSSRLPEDWRQRLIGQGDAERAQHIADYIAGMTDRFALQEHRRLFDATPDLR